MEKYKATNMTNAFLSPFFFFNRLIFQHTSSNVVALAKIIKSMTDDGLLRKKLSKQTFEHKVARILTHVIRSWLFIGSANETNHI